MFPSQIAVKMSKFRYLWGFVVAITVFTFLGCLLVVQQQSQVLRPKWSTQENLSNINWSSINTSSVAKFKRLAEDDYSRLIDVNNFEFPRSHKGCHQMENKPKIVIIVPSAPDNFAKRKTIRDTWGAKDPRSLLLFIIGTFNNSDWDRKIEWEAMTNDDIIQGNFIDAYRNMTYKHTAALKWFVYNCPDSKFLLKVFM